MNFDGFRLPAEWEPQVRTWMTWPQNLDTWYSGSINKAEEEYTSFVNYIAKSQIACIQCSSNETIERVKKRFADLTNIEFYCHPTNDAWCRDYGPDFLINKDSKYKITLDWQFNSWGDKYPPYDEDNKTPERISDVLELNSVVLDMILEGGSIEVNGQGHLITTKSCLLNQNRNKDLDQEQIEEMLKGLFQVNNIVWLEDGIEGDDTDGHIDDFCRFVPNGNILLAKDEFSEKNDAILKANKILLIKHFPNSEIIDVPLPKKEIFFEGEKLPASYLNYCLTNEHVIVPIFGDENDRIALEIIRENFPEREVVGLRANHLVIGLGGFHCLTKHEPSL